MAANKIQVGYIEAQDGAQFEVDAGTAAAPGLCFDNSAATGLYSPGTGQIAWSTSGKQTALRILADGKVGVDCSPTVAFEVNGTIKASAIDAPIEGTLDDWIVHAGDTNTKIGFSANDTFQVHTGGSAKLQCDTDGVKAYNGRFYSAGTFAYIESSSTSHSTLTLKKTASGADAIDYLQLRDNSNALKLKIGGDGIIYTTDVLASHEGDTDTKIRFPSNDNFTIELSGDEKFRLDGGQAKFKVGTNKTVKFYAPTHNDESDLGAGIGFSRVSDGAELLSGIFGHSNTGLGIAARDHVTILTGGTSNVSDTEERVRITSTGQVRIGNANNIAAWGQNNRLQVAGTDWSTSGITIAKLADSGATANLVFGVSRGTTPGTAITSGDRLGYISFTGDDGTDIHTVGAAIVAGTDAAPSSNSISGTLQFYTGGNQTSDQRLHIDSSGRSLTYGTLGAGNLPLSGNAANSAIQIRCQSKYQGIAFGEGATHATIGRGANNAALVFVANANPANLGGGAKTTFEWWSGSAGGGGPGKIMGMEADGKLTIGDGNELASSYGANLLVDGGSGSQLTLVGSTSGWGKLSFADGSGNDATKNAGFIYMNHHDNLLSLGLADVNKLFIRNAGSNRGQLELYGNFNEESTPALELNDGGDARKAYISNTSGDLVLWTRNASRIGGKIKMFESGTLRYDKVDPDNASNLHKCFQTSNYKVNSGSTNQSTTYTTQYIIAGGWGGDEGMYHGRTNFTVNAANNDHYQPVAFVPMGYNLDSTSFGGHFFGDVWINQSGSQKPSDFGGTNTNWATMSAQIKWDCAHWNAKPQLSSVVHYVNHGQANIGRLFFSGTQAMWIGWFLPGYYAVQYRVNRGLSVHTATSAGGSILVRHSSSFFTASSMAYSSRNTQFDSAIMYGGNGSHHT